LFVRLILRSPLSFPPFPSTPLFRSRRYENLFTGGEGVPPSSSLAFEVISPHTESPTARVAAPAPADIDRAVATARRAFDTGPWPDRKSTRLNSSHVKISYAVFCLKK